MNDDSYDYITPSWLSLFVRIHLFNLFHAHNNLPFYWFGYVITDNNVSSGGKGFWSPIPRFMTNLNRRYSNGHWDYWSVKNEREYRYAQRQANEWSDENR